MLFSDWTTTTQELSSDQVMQSEPVKLSNQFHVIAFHPLISFNLSLSWLWVFNPVPLQVGENLVAG